jgi:hypothetical protein
MTTSTKSTVETEKYRDLAHHSLAEIFPLMEGDEFDALVEDIKANGLREPIWLYEDKILDGRNRYRALVKAKSYYGLKEENFRTYTGSDPLGLVVSANLHRRHLNESQRALVAARIVTTKLGDNQHKNGSISIDNAAKMLSVSEATVKTAKKVAESAAPEIKEKVLKGELRLGMAKEVIKKSKEEQVAELERIKTEAQKRKDDAKAKADAARAAKQAANVTPNQPKPNQAMKDVDDFKAKWQSFTDVQRRAFVMMLKDELAAILDDVQQQEAILGAKAA